MTIAGPIPIIRRRVDIDFSDAPAQEWYEGELFWEQTLNAISYFFPAGERFFISSVQHYEARITDPLLREQVKQFIYQEAMHTREHLECNKRLSHSFPHASLIDRMGGGLLKLAGYMPPAFQLAVSCAIEHYTATMSDYLLRCQDSFTKYAHTSFCQLWLWHAVEETEHKAVCFDVYEAAVGKGVFAYLLRVLAMLVTTLGFAMAAVIGLMLIKWDYRKVENKPAQPTGKSISLRLVLQDLARAIPWRSYLDYFRYGFHPWDHDNSALVSAWKARFPDFGSSPDRQETRGLTPAS